jgi:hypothetical protein
MSETNLSNSSNLITAFKYPFSDPRWFQKLLVGALLILASMIIWLIPSIFVLGYLYRISRRIISGDGQATLPEWDDWGGLFKDGIKLFGIGFIYLLPAFIVFVAAYAVMFIPYFSIMARTFTSHGPEASPVMPSSIFMIFLMYPLMGLGMLLSLATIVFLPPAIMHATATGTFKGGFQFSEWWKVFRANLGGFFIANLLLLGNLAVLYFVITFVMMTIVLICLYPALLVAISIYIGTVTYALYAEAYRNGQAKMAVMSAKAISKVPAKGTRVITKKP